MKKKVYIYGWPGVIGGTTTKFTHLVEVLAPLCQLTFIPHERKLLSEKPTIAFLKSWGASIIELHDLPNRVEGVAIAAAALDFFERGLARRLKERGLKVFWSNEMMWYFPGEVEAIRQGVVDKVLFLSKFQRDFLLDGYGDVPHCIVDNYVSPKYFAYRDRSYPDFRIGRLSRADPVKYPDDFPAFYENLDLPETRFRVMAWDKKTAANYKWFHFDKRWELLKPLQETPEAFLQSLDLFVYSLGHRFKESWGRSTVEASLTGAIPIVPSGHHFNNLVVDGVTGYLCDSFAAFKEHCNHLYADFPLRRKMALAGREYTANELCNIARHRRIWKEALEC